ncbi:mitogen-activated protein kinase kinase kinase 20-like [Patiria miniata]|uniref:Protein kinase domain-containing protein n=1 Tax=Patiria miniata TaxID=46514 RepID=A0A913ZWI7_PATMI|nr:mitogen-activated protein kinase kinase kinase 20-like [Patiria miniata]
MKKSSYTVIDRGHISNDFRLISNKSKNPVYLTKWKKSSGEQTVAAKCCHHFHEDEAAILARLNHKNIIKFFGVVLPTSIGESHIIVTEYAEEGSLHDVIARHCEHWPEYMQIESRWMKWAQDGARALQFIHQNKYQHGDVKSPNFLVTSDGTLKICDFGISRKCELTISTVSNRGSWPWMAPEAFGSVAYDPQSTRKPCKVTTKSDVFSYSIVIWEIMSGQAPHPGKQQIQIYKAVVERKERPQIPSHCPEHQQMSELLNKCWQAEYRSRPTMDEVLQTLLDIDKSMRESTCITQSINISN